jgi:hypothetical protein
MKTTVSITLDIEIWSAARAKYTNLSSRIEELLEQDLKLQEKTTDALSLQKELERNKALVSALQRELKATKEEQKKPKHNFEFIEE